ncbi:MAG: GTPase ObgE [Thermodesulfobacteriota bacterium]
MKFIDEVTITVQSGNGGRGCVSFRRERFIPRGGPDGGDGGDGGSVILRSTDRKRTLYHFQFKRSFNAKNGSGGEGSQKTGKNGSDLIIEVPPGTLVSDIATGQVIKDFLQADETFVAAKGGRGGRGNMRFKSSTNRAPRYAQPGEPGQTLTLKLELKLLADVGIIGLPNAGKSTLVGAITSAKPKTGAYPFTTLTPTLGVVKFDRREPFVVADIPGLIEGAHSGAGLGTRFLRHIERTHILVHLIDASGIDPSDPFKGYDTINRELAQYNKALVEKPQLLVLNKIDVPGSRELCQKFLTAAAGANVLLISAVTGEGLNELKKRLLQLLDRRHG